MDTCQVATCWVRRWAFARGLTMISRQHVLWSILFMSPKLTKNLPVCQTALQDLLIFPGCLESSRSKAHQPWTWAGSASQAAIPPAELSARWTNFYWTKCFEHGKMIGRNYSLEMFKAYDLERMLYNYIRCIQLFGIQHVAGERSPVGNPTFPEAFKGNNRSDRTSAVTDSSCMLSQRYGQYHSQGATVLDGREYTRALWTEKHVAALKS